MEIINREFMYPGKDISFKLFIENFKINYGEVVYLHGRSGCGKTTLLNLLSGVIESEIKNLSRKYYKTISYVMHESTLLPWLSIVDNIKTEEKLREQKCNMDLLKELFNRYFLDNDILMVKPSQISLGMRQRIEIAKALSFRPGLLLLDEALSGIDINTKRIVANSIWETILRDKTTVIGTAHQMVDILMIAQRVYIIKNGKLNEFIEIVKSVDERLHMEYEELYRLDIADKIMMYY